MDKSIVIEPIKNAISVELTKNSVITTLVKIESIYGFVAPIQAIIERKEVG
ncbi:hypothetical protein LOZ80_14980 [Paenibacillus sp. HWE-109]|uniref:hypothetical protein n=1 Tax=Paenibacillus sp. HWE-109 TaxID=1306526 RepID=UPI001EDDEC25|nr:hypothetical protein [Paenibacillus sp. HWE-109]UKS30165.1 hypothetical protein LOZ80_14980 [Paenibacillus sp. HWE-109]